MVSEQDVIFHLSERNRSQLSSKSSLATLTNARQRRIVTYHHSNSPTLHRPQIFRFLVRVGTSSFPFRHEILSNFRHLSRSLVCRNMCRSRPGIRNYFRPGENKAFTCVSWAKLSQKCPSKANALALKGCLWPHPNLVR